MEPHTIRLKEIKPVLTGYIREAISLLDDAPDEKAIHDIRVLLKKARAVIRLTKKYSDSDFSERNLNDLREAALVMASWRDMSVQRKFLREMRKEEPALFGQLEGNERIMTLLRKPNQNDKPEEDVLSGIGQIRSLLRRTSMRLRFVNLSGIEPEELLKELEFTYIRVAEKFLKCRLDQKPKSIHNFRKKSKDFLYQLSFFRPLNNRQIRNIEKKLEDMTKNLGKFNDMNQLITALEYTYPDSSGNTALNEFIIRIKEKQDLYISRVWPVAGKVFCPGKKLLNLLGYRMIVFQNNRNDIQSDQKAPVVIYTYSK